MSILLSSPPCDHLVDLLLLPGNTSLSYAVLVAPLPHHELVGRRPLMQLILSGDYEGESWVPEEQFIVQFDKVLSLKMYLNYRWALVLNTI